MSRYATRLSCVLCLLTVFSAFFWCSTAHAQSANNTPVYYKIIGTNTQVTPAGTPALNTLDVVCPLRTLALTNSGKDFDAATKAAKSAGDADSAPFAVSPDGKEHVYFSAMPDCQAFFMELAKTAGGDAGPVATIACGYLAPGPERAVCKNLISSNTAATQAAAGKLQIVTNTPPPGPAASSGMSQAQIDAQNKANKDKEDADKSCFDASMHRVGQYWTKQYSAACVKTATKMIKDAIKADLAKETKHMEKKGAVNTASNGQGSSPGVIVSLPTAVGAIQFLITTVKYLLAIVQVAADNASKLDYLLNNCLHISSNFGQLSTWRKGVLGGDCQALTSIVERQLTQCVRVNIAFDLKLPQFAIMTQCPFNISIQAYMSTQGSHFNFDCVSQNPVASAGAAWGGQSLLGPSGGLEGIFNGKCFGSNTTAPTGANAGGRIPGVDCSPSLSPDPVRSTALQGQIPLAAGTAIADGWVAGQTEKLTASDGSEQQITRCDMYANGTRTRTTYVYGSGGSCNASTTGFTQDGYETNTQCYTGGYLPKTNGDSAPDACLYPYDCLNPNNNYAFDPSRIGTGNCTQASAQPVLDATRSYPIAQNSGTNAGQVTWNSCSDFNGVADQAPVCCDPQKQDCRDARVKNIPICQCDQGDSSNSFIDPATGQPFPGNKCDPNKGGGLRTCCTASLNGGIAGCTDPNQVGFPGSQVCANGDQCSSKDDIVGTDANGNQIAAKDANTAAASPFSYLAVRPDVSLTTQTNTDGSPKQCCSTPWCNICPQQYANAYGIAMARADWNAPKPADDAPLSAVRSYNNSLLGKGWPFTTSTDPNTNETIYTIGVHPSVLNITRAIKVPGALGLGSKWQEDDSTTSVAQPMLHLSDKMDNKLSDAQFTNCQDIQGWKIGYTSADNFGQSSSNSMGYVYDSYVETPNSNKVTWQVLSGLSEPRETTMDYMNRMQANQVDGNGVPRDPIALCSDVVKMCTPGTNPSGSSTPQTQSVSPNGRVSTTSTNSVTTTSTGNTSNPSGSAGMIALSPAAMTPTVGTGTAPTAVGRSLASTPSVTSATPSGATLVPSVSGGGGTGSLF